MENGFVAKIRTKGADGQVGRGFGRPGRVPVHELRVPIAPVQGAPTNFFAASIVRARGPIQSGLGPVRAGGRHAASIIS